MCGIVGCIGVENAREIVLTGLARLEYRGYDSCGIGLIKNDQFIINKSTNRVADLQKISSDESNCVIGHTRWATHGGVTTVNAHPHQSSNGRFILVHNGVIDNYLEIKAQFSDIKFQSQTDTEVILELLSSLISEHGSFEQAMVRFFRLVRGSYSCVLMDKQNPNFLYTFKNKTPMMIGRGQGFYTVASDPTASYDVVAEFCRLDDYQFAVIDCANDQVHVYQKDGQVVPTVFAEIAIDDFVLELGNYDCYMLKEIEEQPKVLKNIIKQYENYQINPQLKEQILNAPKIYIVASGTSHNAGLIAKRMFERDLKIPTEVVLGSEFGYDDNLIPDNSVFIFMSQSGETADSLIVFNAINGRYPTLAITNTRGSQLDQRADYSLLLYAAIEVAVASTKAYTANIAVIGILVGLLSDTLSNVIAQLELVIIEQQKVLNDKDKFKPIAQKIANHDAGIIVGRLHDYDVALEAALKIKEVTYININCYPGGELKHGPLSLIDEKMLVMALIGQTNIAEATRSNIEEIKARQGHVITFARNDLARPNDDYVFDFAADELFISMVCVIPFQYISYYVAIAKNLDVDKPRNLAKAVTVE